MKDVKDRGEAEMWRIDNLIWFGFALCLWNAECKSVSC